MVGGVFATLTEVVLVRPLYARHVGQVLVTVGLALATISLVQGGFGSDPKTLQLPALDDDHDDRRWVRTSRTRGCW